MSTWHAFSFKKRWVTIGGRGCWQLVCCDSAVKSCCISVMIYCTFCFTNMEVDYCVFIVCWTFNLFWRFLTVAAIELWVLLSQKFWCVFLMAFLYVVDSFHAFCTILITLPLSFCYPDMKNLKLFSQLLIIIWFFSLHSENKQQYKI
jgi:hypothetical protein